MTRTQELYNLIAYLLRVTAEELAMHLRWNIKEVSAELCQLLLAEAIESQCQYGQRFYGPA
jgi:hypothetical protein